MIVELTYEEREFFQQYLETAEWADPPEEDWYTDLDKVTLCPTWEREALLDCLAFYSKFSVFLGHDQIEHAAHDFYLSRNGHGTGFWDDGGENYPTWMAERMQRFSEAMGEHQIMYEEEE